jgi:hypothetical protein
MRRTPLLLPVLLLAGAACGHSEEEWQAMLHRQRELQERCQVWAVPAPPAATVGCARDVDCKGDRICTLGTCTSPH